MRQKEKEREKETLRLRKSRTVSFPVVVTVAQFRILLDKAGKVSKEKIESYEPQALTFLVSISITGIYALLVPYPKSIDAKRKPNNPLQHSCNIEEQWKCC